MTPKFLKISRYLLMAVLLLLILQYVLGMIANIYATPPYGPSNIGAHYVIGYVVALVGLITLIFVVFSRQVGAISFSAIGFISILLAGESGRGFAFLSQHNGVYSLAMALFWLLSFSSYFICLFLITPHSPENQTTDKGKGFHEI
ncbi:MAG: hypothetical protein M1515_03250 [Candidatus Thermoplasmatota archaeon]|nr:hypothetical protein [Candidatus Thermoplasmatota archaeon]